MTSLTLAGQLRAVAESYRAKAAVRIDDECITYGSLLDHAAQLQRALALVDSPFLGLLGRKSAIMFHGIFAAIQSGCPYMPLNPDEPVERLAAMLARSGCRVLLAEADGEKLLRALLGSVSEPLVVILPDTATAPDWWPQAGPHRCIAGAELAALQGAGRTPGVAPLAYLLFTSGSTGTPKMVTVTQHQVSAYVANIVERSRPSAEDRFSQLAPLSFDFSVHDIFVAWSVGASIHPCPQRDIYSLASFIVRHGISIWASVPSTITFLNRSRQLAAGVFPAMRHAFFCGEALPESLAVKWHEAAPNCVIDNLYGPTEATVAVTAYRWTPAGEAGIVPIGLPFANIDVALVRDDGSEAADGEAGELWLAGDQVVDCYASDPERTSVSFADRHGRRWYRTGDYAQRAADGCLRYRGRADDQLQVRGQRVERKEIEVLLRGLAGGVDVAVMGWPPERGNQVEGLVFIVDDDTLDLMALRRQCQQHLAVYMQPLRIIAQPIPASRNGKVDYRRLGAMLAELMSAPGAGAVAPPETR